jgi:hypothetical protein
LKRDPPILIYDPVCPFHHRAKTSVLPRDSLMFGPSGPVKSYIPQIAGQSSANFLGYARKARAGTPRRAILIQYWVFVKLCG